MRTALRLGVALRRGLFVLAVGLLTAVGGCGTDAEEAARVERSAAVYADIVRDALGDDAFEGLDDPEDLVVQLYPLGGDQTIALDVQVEVLERLSGFATVRFVDEFEEAVREDEPGVPVLADGIALGLGTIDAAGSQVDAVRYRGEEAVTGLTYVARRGDDEWTAERTGTYDPASPSAASSSPST